MSSWSFTVTTFVIIPGRSKNFPFRKEASDMDIEMPDGTGDADYLDALERGICRTLANAVRRRSSPFFSSSRERNKMTFRPVSSGCFARNRPGTASPARSGS